MDKKEATERVAKLREEINHHRYLYHVKDTQEISDSALDSLKKELDQLEKEHPSLVTPDSPTQRVGGRPLPELENIQHRSRMLSLQDVFSFEELEKWEDRNRKIVNTDFQYFSELKIDGVAVSLIYEDGHLVRAVTRGDGYTGENVTHNIRTIEAVPLRLYGEHKGLIEVRGEVYLLKEDFKKMNEQRAKAGKPLFANPRNIAAGSIRQLDPAVATARPLRFFAWEITEGIPSTSREDEYKTLTGLGFPVPPDAQLFKDLSEVPGLIRSLEEKRNNYPFLVDGIVFKINNLAVSDRLGVVGKAPRGSVAYKFAAEEATTVIEDIVVQVGRTGVLTPVAHVRPVKVAGTTVSRATLHNIDEIHRKDVRVGDTVIIRKAGDIIPEIVQSLPKLRPGSAREFMMPEKCPVCGGPIKREEGGVAFRCLNKNCFTIKREQIAHAVGDNGFDIEGLGDKIIEQLLQEGLVKQPPDLWELKEGDLLPLELFAEKKATKLVEEIQSRKEIPLAKFLVALSIPNVGTVTAQDLAREFQSLEKIQTVTASELERVEGIGEKVARSIQEFFSASDTKELINKYISVGISISQESGAGPLSGKTFVFTGSLGDITRGEAKQLVIQKGGKVASAVGKEVDYVVVGEDAGSKEAKAKQLGLATLSPEEFRKIIS